MTGVHDVPSSYPYGDTTRALTLNGRDRDNIGRADFVALGEAAGVRPRAVEGALDELRARVDLWIDGIDELPFDGGVLRTLRRAVEYRRERLR